MTAPNPLFLRDEELDRGLESLFLAGRQLAAEAEALLDEAGLNELDHRLLFCIQRRPGITLIELCTLMGISKQTLSRHLRDLGRRGLVGQGAAAGDRRKRPLVVTPEAGEIVRRVNAAQRRRLRAVFKSADAAAVEGFQKVLNELVTGPRRQVTREPALRARAG
jgi:DNA-binding MarR family transcriptional regulator